MGNAISLPPGRTSGNRELSTNRTPNHSPPTGRRRAAWAVANPVGELHPILAVLSEASRTMAAPWASALSPLRWRDATRWDAESARWDRDALPVVHRLPGCADGAERGLGAATLSTTAFLPGAAPGVGERHGDNAIGADRRDDDRGPRPSLRRAPPHPGQCVGGRRRVSELAGAGVDRRSSIDAPTRPENPVRLRPLARVNTGPAGRRHGPERAFWDMCSSERLLVVGDHPG